jgi:hypothetical protein
MPEPSIEALGVCALPVTADLLREQADILYDADRAELSRTTRVPGPGRGLDPGPG